MRLGFDYGSNANAGSNIEGKLHTDVQVVTYTPILHYLHFHTTSIKFPLANMSTYTSTLGTFLFHHNSTVRRYKLPF